MAIQSAQSVLFQRCFSAVRGCFCSSPLRVFLQVWCCFELHSLLLMSSLPRRTLSLPEMYHDQFCFILLLSLPVLSTFWPPWWLGWFAGYTSARFYKMWKGEVRVQHNTVSVSANLIHKRAWWVVAEPRQGLEENNASDCLLVPSTYFCSQRISLHYLFI